jgi:hypothetical protein
MVNKSAGENMVLGKKGIFFSILAMALVSFFILTYTFVSFAEDSNSVEKRVQTMSNFVLAIEEDLERQVYISGFRIIFLFQNKTIGEGSYMPDFDERFQEAIFNGTINNVSEPFLTKITVSDILASINDKAETVNAEVNFSNVEVIVSHDDPWNVKVRLITNLTVRDVSDLVSWEKEEIIDAYIPIDNFEDPLYFVETNGIMTNSFSKSPYNNFIELGDTSNLSSHLWNSYYTASTSGPSFIDRMKGNMSPSNYGIESLVNLEILDTRGGEPEAKSVVDYIYFSNDYPASCQVGELSAEYPWFILDTAHRAKYNVSAC